MTARSRRLAGRWGAIGAIAFGYFVAYPDDLAALLAPVEVILEPIRSVLTLSGAVSPWLYGLLAVIVAADTVRRVMGRGEGAKARPPGPIN